MKNPVEATYEDLLYHLQPGAAAPGSMTFESKKVLVQVKAAHDLIAVIRQSSEAANELSEKVVDLNGKLVLLTAVLVGLGVLQLWNHLDMGSGLHLR